MRAGFESCNLRKSWAPEWACGFCTRLFVVLDCAPHTPNLWQGARGPGNQVVGANFAEMPRDALLFQREPVS